MLKEKNGVIYESSRNDSFIYKHLEEGWGKITSKVQVRIDQNRSEPLTVGAQSHVYMWMCVYSGLFHHTNVYGNQTQEWQELRVSQSGPEITKKTSSV